MGHPAVRLSLELKSRYRLLFVRVTPLSQLRFAQGRWFWQVRAWVRRVQFQVLSRAFRVKYLAQEERTSASILSQFAWATALQFSFAIAIVVVLQILELVFINFLIVRWPLPKPDIYTTWLATLAQISGVFIALYFTAVTAAAAAIYAEVPNNVRDLLARERVGNVYIRYLSFATFLPLCLIAIHLLGFEPLRIAVPLLVVVAGVGIIAFTKLGQRAFNLFDPTKLSYVLFADLNRWIRQVTPGGFRWLDRSFQQHAHRQAAAIVDTLETVIEVASTQSNSKGRAPLELVGGMLAFLSQYQFDKRKIPFGSLWFAQKYLHKDWYRSEDSAVQIAHTTGTVLSPNTITETNWIEEDIERVALKFFETSVSASRLDDHLEYFRWIERYIDALASNGHTRRSCTFIEGIQEVYRRSALVDKATLSTESMKSVAVTEMLAYLHLHNLISYANSLEKRSYQRTKVQLRSVNW